ncbi:MAG: BspA family leucine-rich repeat surface protein, partial [Lachnospiraceae bacterium]|nr:BspA family leucine-rich repeat surface protein [Lachnospiraceae bacterium]
MAAVMAVVLMCGSVDTSLLVYATNVEDGAEEEVGEESLETEFSEVEEPVEEEQENTATDGSAVDGGESVSSEEAGQEGTTEVVETEETAEETVSSFGASNIASGSDGNVTWVIDKNNTLTVTGTGEFSTSTDQDRAPWYSYRYYILKAEIYLSETTDLSYMFRHCSNLTSVDLSGFNPGTITDMSYMFSGCSSLESIDLSGLDTGSVTNMGNLFSNCDALSSVNLNNLDTGNVTDMSYMFYGCSSLENIDLSGFDTSSLTSMESMFSWCRNLTNINLSGLETSNVTNMSSVFSFSSSLTKVDLSGLNTSSVTDMSGMFSCCSSLASVDLSNLNAGNVTNMNGMFSLCTSLTNIDLRGLDTSRLESMNNMFNGCSSLENIDLSSLDTSNVTAMGGMFSDCSSLASIDLSNFDTGNVTAMSSLFSRCSSLTDINLSGLDTGNVTDMSYMFIGCTSLTNIDLSGLDTSSVTNMSWMFCGCSSLASIDLSGFVTDSITTMRGMFGTSGSLACSNLTSINLSGLETYSVTDMSRMFIGCSSLTSIDLSDFDTSNVTSMDDIFDSCDALSYIKTPRNLNISVELYESDWYMFDGTIVTELPQGLPYSVELAKGSIPEGGDPQYAKIVSLSPENGSDNQGYNAANTPTFSITFDREISGMDTPNNVTFADLDFDAGTLKIFRSMDDELIYEVTYDDYVNTFYGIEGTTSSDVSIINDVTFLLKPFNAHTLLDSSTEYYVTVDKGFIKFTDGTVNAAITKEMWTFQTEMFTTTADVTIKASDDVTTDISVDWTDSWFQNTTSTYCHELAIASIALSSSAYVESGGEPASDSVEAALQDFGFEVEAYNYDYPLSDDDNDVVSFAFGEKNYEDTKLIAIIIKGTSGNEEWYSNFNISESKSDSNADHTGFRLAADDLIEQLESYLDTLGDIDKSRIKFYVTGHSRGAGVANLVAATLTDKYTQNNVFAYTFAAPTVSKNATENGYENIYNIINEEDFVTQIPLSTWGFGRYGVDLALPSRSWKGKSYSTLAAKRDATYTGLIGEDYAEYLCGTFNLNFPIFSHSNSSQSGYC